MRSEPWAQMLEVALRSNPVPDDWNSNSESLSIVGEGAKVFLRRYNLASAISSDVGIMREVLKFLFPPSVKTMYVCDGNLGTLLCGAALANGIPGVISIGGVNETPHLPPPGYLGRPIPSPEDICVVRGCLMGREDPQRSWRVASLLLKMSEVNPKISVRCIVDAREPELRFPSTSSLEAKLIDVDSMIGPDNLP